MANLASVGLRAIDSSVEDGELKVRIAFDVSLDDIRRYLASLTPEGLAALRAEDIAPGRKVLDPFKGMTLIRSLVRDQLAEYAHEAWAGWWDYQLTKAEVNDDGTVTINPESTARWTRQANTGYVELPREEQASDLVEADKILAIIESGGWRGGWEKKVYPD